MSQYENQAVQGLLNYQNQQNWNSFQGTHTGDNLKGGLIGNGTIGYMQTCGEREKFCPRDGHSFNCGDNYCSRCGRPVGYLTWEYRPTPTTPYTITWGSQAAQSNQQLFAAYNQAAVAASACDEKSGNGIE